MLPVAVAWVLVLVLLLSARRRLDAYPWLLKVAVWSIPLPWVAAEAGWIVAEVGRQPWVIEGVLPTAVGVSSLGAGTVLLTIAGFTLIYTVLFVIEMKLMLRAICKGPEGHAPKDDRHVPPQPQLASGPLAAPLVPAPAR